MQYIFMNKVVQNYIKQEAQLLLRKACSMAVTSLYPTVQKTFQNAGPFRCAHQLSPMFK